MNKKDVFLATVAVAGFLSAILSHVDFAGRPADVEPGVGCAAEAREPAVPAPDEPAASGETVKAQPPANPRVKVPESPRDDGEILISNCSYDGKNAITLCLTERPDIDAAKSYITIDPAPSNGWTAVETVEWYSYTPNPGLRIYGDFPFGKPFTVRVAQGLPGLRDREGAAPTALKRTWSREFVRPDLAPAVEFKDSGRYLPPCGRRLVAVESVNCEKLDIEVFRLPAANIVEMLAFEEGAYNYLSKLYWGADGDKFASDLSGAAWKERINTVCAPNMEETNAFSLLPADGGASNGVFLVKASGASATGRSDEGWKVVCVSDIGISVREAKEGLYVWAVSLSTGSPVAGADVTAYSTANIPVARGRTDAGGLAFCRKERDEAPFAVVATAADGSDMSFVALGRSSRVEESFESGEGYLDDDELTAFAWTDRGIYRHGEKIFFGAVVRNGKGEAPRPLPLVVRMEGPLRRTLPERTIVTGETGILSFDDASVPQDAPGGTWRFTVRTPGEKGRVLATREIRVEEFVPPHIRVAAAADAGRVPAGFGFSVSAENLFGDPAEGLACEGIAVFEDAPFAPAGWEGWEFGDETRSLKTGPVRLGRGILDGNGRFHFNAPLPDAAGLAAAAVKATVQGTVFEDGGRPAVARDTAVLHQHPFYIGAALKRWCKLPETGRAKIRVACVAPDGSRLAGKKRLGVVFEREERVAAYRKPWDLNRWGVWEVNPVRIPVAAAAHLETDGTGETEYEIPVDSPGTYFLKISDAESGASFARTFHLGRWGESGEIGNLSKPAAVSVVPDKDFYRPGETPRLRIKAPFAGTALLTVCRDDIVYVETLELPAPVCEIALREAAPEWAPNVNVSVCVVKGAERGGRLAPRAHGETRVRVRRPENEIPVAVKSALSGRSLSVEVSAPGAEAAFVTVVDEGINILTDEPVPDPVAHFATPRRTFLSAYDIYRRILPFYGADDVRASGLHAGGGAGAGILDRISPAPGRRFKPLALWSGKIDVAGGACRAGFELPEFSGEIRVVAVAVSGCATGAAAEFVKVRPKLVGLPDAPRFVAPGDRFRISLPLSNPSGTAEEAGVAEYRIETENRASGVKSTVAKGSVLIAPDGKNALHFDATAPEEPGELAIRFEWAGFGERHEDEIFLPVRPAVPWRETAGFAELGKGEKFRPRKSGGGTVSKFSWSASSNPAAKLKGALDWLLEYPYGCLEQTSSQIFPLVSAGGILNAVSPDKAGDREAYVKAGIRRVESMVRPGGFVMWPDCTYEPWDEEVSLYAAHFLEEAWRSVGSRDSERRRMVESWLRKKQFSPVNSVSAYACHTLAIAGKADKDRMHFLYDRRDGLDLLSRSRLARAFAATGDAARAGDLLANAASPSSVKEAAFALLALLELGEEGEKTEFLAGWLYSKMDERSCAWDTTSANAHALLALGEYWRRRGFAGGTPRVAEKDGEIVNEGDGTAFVSWRRLDLPDPADCGDEAEGISVKREFLAQDGSPYDAASAVCGDLVVARLTLEAREGRELNDLVVQDLFAGAMEPVRSGTPLPPLPENAVEPGEWVMRSEARDDRMLVFSKKFRLEKGVKAVFQHPLRVVGAGEYALPPVCVEAMYEPALHARSGARRVLAAPRNESCGQR